MTAFLNVHSLVHKLKMISTFYRRLFDSKLELHQVDEASNLVTD